MIPRDPDVNPWLVALASAIVPGAGQVWVGQWVRGAGLFAASAAVCFGFGLANLVVAVDAWSLAARLRTEDIGTRQSSRFLFWLSVLWMVVALPLRAVVALLDRMAEDPRAGLLFFPWSLLRKGIPSGKGDW